MTDPLSRKNLTFEQAEGAQPLPRQLMPKEISQELRAVMWGQIYAQLRFRLVGALRSHPVLDEPWQSIMMAHHVYRKHRPADEYNSSFDENATQIKKIIMSGDYLEFFGFLQWLLRVRGRPSGLPKIINEVLVGTQAGYRIVDQDTIAPYATEAEAQALSSALANVKAVKFAGALQHLRSATSHATSGRWSDSIRESVHAVEASARMLVPGTKELGPALLALEKGQVIHPALKKGFGAIYGFTSDEQGIRHPLVDDPAAKPGEEEALFMLGACASFISYLINKGRSAGLIKD